MILCSFGCDAVMSSVSSYIIGPEHEISALNQILEFDADGEIKCDKLQDMPGIYLINKFYIV